MSWTTTLLRYVFMIITIIANCITVFSDIASSSIFINHHTIEIAILRSVGFTTGQVYLSYN